jgi:hypothetical protein
MFSCIFKHSTYVILNVSPMCSECEINYGYLHALKRHMRLQESLNHYTIKHIYLMFTFR